MKEARCHIRFLKLNRNCYKSQNCSVLRSLLKKESGTLIFQILFKIRLKVSTQKNFGKMDMDINILATVNKFINIYELHMIQSI